jgi:hypothetical protein
LLLIHTPLHGKHIVTLIPPPALLAGLGASLAFASLRQANLSRFSVPAGLWPRLGAVLIAAGLAAYVLTLPTIVARDSKLIFDPDPLESDPAAYWYPEVAATLRAITGEHDMIVTDHPYLTFSAGRLVPPPLVESSVTRVVAGSLTPDDTIAAATQYHARAFLLWADKLTTMRELKAWVDKNYQPVRTYGADGEAMPTLYVASDLVATANSWLASKSPTPIDADFEGLIRVSSFGVDSTRLAPGDVTAVNVSLVAPVKPPASYRAVFQLRGDDGNLWQSDELALGGLGPGSSSWQPGRAMSLSALIRLPRNTKPGIYSLSLRLSDPRAKRFLDSDVPAGEPGRNDPKGVTLTTVQVVPAR